MTFADLAAASAAGIFLHILLVLDGNCYEMATFNEGKCLLPTCSKSGRLTIFKLQAVKKLIECAVERHDLEIRDKMQDILASVQLHKNCYCSYTSKDHIKNLASMKRKATPAPVITEPPIARVRRSQVSEFDFKKTLFILC